jgi:hypothetical protein
VFPCFISLLISRATRKVVKTVPVFKVLNLRLAPLPHQGKPSADSSESTSALLAGIDAEMCEAVRAERLGFLSSHSHAWFALQIAWLQELRAFSSAMRLGRLRLSDKVFMCTVSQNPEFAVAFRCPLGIFCSSVVRIYARYP